MNLEISFQDLIDSSSNSICILDNKANIIAINKSWKNFAIENNYQYKDFGLGENYIDICLKAKNELNNTDIESIINNIQDILDKKSNFFEVIYPCNSPVLERWFKMKIKPIKLNQNEYGLIIVHTNITEVIKKEQELSNKESILLDAQKMAKIGFWECDLNTNSISWSEELFEIFELEKTTEITPESFLPLIHPEDKEFIQKKNEEFTSNNEKTQFQNYKIITKKNNIKYLSSKKNKVFDNHNNIVKLFGIVQDITQVTRYESFFKKVYEITSKSIGAEYFHNLTNFLCKEFDVEYSAVGEYLDNENRLDILSYSQIEGKNNSSFLCNDIKDTPCEAIITYKKSFAYEKNLMKLFPECKFIQEFKLDSYIGFPLLNKNNQIIGIIFLMDNKPLKDIDYISKFLSIISIRTQSELERLITERDIFKRKHELESTIQELRNTQKQVIQQERLIALGQMASGVAHDFNNALTPILGFSELIINKPNLDHQKIISYAKYIKISAYDAANVVRNLREFYRNSDKDKYEALDINNLVKDVVNLTKHKWKNQAFERNCHIQVETILNTNEKFNGNKSEIREVLTNLIFNAVDAITKNGTIAIKTYTKANSVVIEVKDTGSGMTEETKQKCFEPFFSTKTYNQGTGLGLAMVYGIIKRHNGIIKVESSIGEGTSMSLSFPITIENMDYNSLIYEQNTVKLDLNILIVDDETIIRDLLREYLELEGFTCKTAKNGREGLEKFNNGYFDLIITDLGMPEMTGLEFSEIVKKLAPEKPIILITGFGDIINDMSSKPDTIDILLSKPIEMENLKKEIYKLFN